jgi:hypothetical protein
MTIPIPDRVERYETLRREGRLLRRAWTRTDADGRERACWLAALSPEAGAVERPAACPAEVMPPWLAELTPSLDDGVSAGDRWDEFAERLGRCAAGWHVLDDSAWARAEVEVKLEALAVAREAVTVDEWGIIPAIDEVSRLLRDGGSPEEWAAARAAVEGAWAAAGAAAWAAARAVAKAAEAAETARAAARAAGDAARTDAWAARAAAGAAAWAADAARAAACAAGAARAAAWDRIAAALFDAIEHEINAARAALEMSDV